MRTPWSGNQFKLTKSKKVSGRTGFFSFSKIRNPFRLISARKSSKKVSDSKSFGKPLDEKLILDNKLISDQKRRLFLKAVGTIGLGALGVSLFPKKSSALVMGGAPATSVVGVKNSSNLSINPATEETVNTLLKKGDLTFSGTDLQVKVTSMPSGSSSSFSDIDDIPKNALVNADRHVQVDVLSSVLPSSASTEATLQTISFGGFKYALRMVTVGNYDYIGEASIGSATSASVWRIKRIDNTSGLVIKWAGTGTFDQVWDNYLSLTYL